MPQNVTIWGRLPCIIADGVLVQNTRHGVSGRSCAKTAWILRGKWAGNVMQAICVSKIQVVLCGAADGEGAWSVVPRHAHIARIGSLRQTRRSNNYKGQVMQSAILAQVKRRNDQGQRFVKPILQYAMSTKTSWCGVSFSTNTIMEKSDGSFAQNKWTIRIRSTASKRL